MIKTLRIFISKKGVTREQFLKHWEEVHGPLFLSKNMPGVRRYVQNHPAPGVDNSIDGIAEIWWDDLKSAEDFKQWLFSSDGGKELIDDLKLIVDIEDGFDFHAEEYVCKEQPARDIGGLNQGAKVNAIKTFYVMKRKKGLSLEQFLKHWKEIHGPLFVSKNIPGVSRYVQNHPVPGIESEVDGIAETWWDDLKSAEDFKRWLFSSEGGKELVDDLNLMIDPGGGFDFHAEEHVLKA